MEEFEKIWANGDHHKVPEHYFDDAFFYQAIRQRTKGINARILSILNMGLILSGLLVAFILLNGWLYWGNRGIMILLLLVLLFDIISVTYLIKQYKKLRNMDQPTLNLHEALETKIHYLSFPFQTVLFFISMLIVLCTFGINLVMEGDDGVFDYANLKILLPFYLFIFIGNVLLFRYLFSAFTRQLKMALANLEQKSLVELEKEEKKAKRMRMILGIIMGGMILAGILTLVFWTSL
jgi:hypothetical protein